MATPNVVLDELSRVESSSFTARSARTFILDDQTTTRIAVYVAQNGKAVMAHSAVVESFDRSRAPRSTPHTITTTDGQTWQVYREGCGCGSPIKRVSWRDAASALLAVVGDTG
jgi:hypothetical protein